MQKKRFMPIKNLTKKWSPKRNLPREIFSKMKKLSTKILLKKMFAQRKNFVKKCLPKKITRQGLGKVKARLSQGQGKIKAKSGKGQGKVIKARSSMQDQGKERSRKG